MPTVAVLMSTYNGEKYIQEQIDSVLNQKYVDVELYIRDDGSKDRTLSLINSIKSNKVHIDKGINIGVGNSFMQLVYSTPDYYDFYAFCDQDDIWLEKKLKRAIEVLENNNKMIYCSNQIIVNEEGKIKGLRYTKPIVLDLVEELQENKVTGCTIVFTSEFKRLVCEKHRRPSNEFIKQQIHDRWFALVGCATDSIIYDEEAFIHYRQHSNNVIGIQKETFSKKVVKWRKKIYNKQLRNSRSKRAREICVRFNDYISNDFIRVCANPAGLKNKMILLKNYFYFKNHNNRLEFMMFVMLGQF